MRPVIVMRLIIIVNVASTPVVVVDLNILNLYFY